MSDDNSDISGDNSDINILFKNFLDVITSSPAHVNSATPPLDSSPSRSKMMSNDNSDGSGDNSDGSRHNSDGSGDNSDGSPHNSDGSGQNIDGPRHNGNGAGDNSNGSCHNSDGSRHNSDSSNDNSDSSSHNRDISSHNSDISSDNSDINVRFKNFLDVITSSPATPPLDSSLSPKAPLNKWDAFLDQATSSPQATQSNPTTPVITSVSQPPESSSESGPSSTGDEYHPSSVPGPVRYVATSDSLPDDGDMQKMIGEFMEVG